MPVYILRPEFSHASETEGDGDLYGKSKPSCLASQDLRYGLSQVEKVLITLRNVVSFWPPLEF